MVSRKSDGLFANYPHWQLGSPSPQTAENRRLQSELFSLNLLLASQPRGCPLTVITFGGEIRNLAGEGSVLPNETVKMGVFFS